MANPTPLSSPETASRDLGRRDRRKLELRGRILQAARELFADRGFDGTRVAEIAERADVAEKTVFNHFPTKQLMIRELAYEAIAELLERVEEIRKQPGTTRERLLEFFDGIADGATERGPMHRELLSETIHALHDARDESQQVQRVHNAFEAIVRDGLERGEFTNAHDPETLTNVILGSFYSLMFSWAHVEEYPVREQARATARFLADALETEAQTGPKGTP
ncbi:MAG: TetR/AcrR family transcriptional regulator [Myxococcota bacterium]|nr:TetR/AcrR family transcriptional regulator [Myxococcota bacterium]